MFPGIADHMQKELTSWSLSGMKVLVFCELPCAFLRPAFIGQDCCASQMEVLGVDWWIHPGIVEHFPKHVVLQTRV